MSRIARDTAAAAPCSLAAVLDRHTPSGAEGNVQCWCGERFCSFAEHAVHQAAAWREACTLRSVEQLSALPEGAAIRSDGRWGRRTLERDDHDGWYEFGDEIPKQTNADLLPAVLVWHPDWDES